MGAFAIIPKSLSATAMQSLLSNFSARGFFENTSYSFRDFDVIYFSKFNGVAQVIEGKDGSIALAVGTLWYKNRSFVEAKELLLNALTTDAFDPNHLAGTYCLLYVNAGKQELNLIHDSRAVYRFYYDDETRIISSSWLSLVWMKEKKNRRIDIQAVLENLVLGFNLGRKTWLEGIHRVQSTSGLPNYIRYYRTTCNPFNDRSHDNFEFAVSESAEVLSDALTSKLSYSTALMLGLSSGYDSRLVASVLLRKNFDRLRFFTFYKPGDKDLEIAQKIASFCDRELKILKTQREVLPELQQIVFEEAFNFFDGQCAVMMQYSKVDYTRKFRSELLSEGDLHLSGVGGELFRNYSHDHVFAIPWNYWINQYFNGGYLAQWLKKSDNVVASIVGELKTTLATQSSLISFEDRKRFYSEIFLSDWYGVRNTIENQYSNYYSPFTDSSVIRQGMKTIGHHGSGGEFEASMIKYLSKDLAKFESEYGYNFIHLPLAYKVKQNLSRWSKIPAISMFRTWVRKEKRMPVLSSFEASIIHEMKEILKDTRIDFDLLLRLKKEQLLVASYIINSIKK